MKVILLAVLASLIAEAQQVDLKKYYLVSGGLGRDGATSESMPLKESIDHANILAKSLKDAEGGILVGEDFFGIDCTEKDSCGLATVVPLSQGERGVEADASQTIVGKVASAIYNALNVAEAKHEDSRVKTVRAGDAVLLECRQKTEKTSCILNHTGRMSFSLEEIFEVPVDMQLMTRKEAEALVKVLLDE